MSPAELREAIDAYLAEMKPRDVYKRLGSKSDRAFFCGGKSIRLTVRQFGSLKKMSFESRIPLMHIIDDAETWHLYNTKMSLSSIYRDIIAKNDKRAAENCNNSENDGV